MLCPVVASPAWAAIRPLRAVLRILAIMCSPVMCYCGISIYGSPLEIFSANNLSSRQAFRDDAGQLGRVLRVGRIAGALQAPRETAGILGIGQHVLIARVVAQHPGVIAE